MNCERLAEMRISGTAQIVAVVAKGESLGFAAGEGTDGDLSGCRWSGKRLG